MPALTEGAETNLVRVLHISSGNLYGGVETTLVAQARHKDPELDMELSFALCFAGRFSEELTKTLAPVYWLNEVRVRNPFSVRHARQRLRGLLQQQRCDVVVTHSCWSQAIFGHVVKDAGLPLVFWLHDAARGRHWLERWAKRTTPDLVLCNSKFTASTLINLYRNVPSQVVYPPHSLACTSSSIADRAAIRRELGTAADAVVIVQVSRMEAWKGHELHLRALSLLKDLPRWVCWQVGGPQRPSEIRYLARLKNLASKLGIADRVRFVGQRSDIPNLLAAADIYCQPNTGPEPFGLTFVEALSARLPIVTTAMGGAQEIVNDSCGVLVAPGDVATITAALRLLIQDKSLRVRLGETGFQRVDELCDPAKQMIKLHSILTEVVNDFVLGRAISGEGQIRNLAGRVIEKAS
jgi:glycosyltransferase involved in cell wall biosynthesis